MTTSEMTPADIAAVTNNNGGGFGFGNDGGAWWIIILFLFAFAGGWNNGGFGGGGNAGAAENYVLASDFATIQRQLSDGFNAQERRTDAIVNGICDLGYTQQSLANTTNMNVSNIGFGLQNAIQQNGYESRLATQNLGAQLANCCCDIREGIQANTTQGVMNTSAIQNQIQQCCCDNEKATMQTRFDMAQYNCATQQAIDKVGDRIIDYLAADKAQALRDENQALRLAASQAAQNNYLVQQLRPAPVPAFPVPNPYQYAGNNGCGCGCGC